MSAVRRGYVQVDGRAVHYRVCGSGPAVVMLHDSPRSSRLHLATMASLADRFTVWALDTPGYGNSAPLGLAQPTIPDFAHALGRTLEALGLAEVPLYATHELAIDPPGKVLRMLAVCMPAEAGRTRLSIYTLRDFARARWLDPLFHHANRKIAREDQAILESSLPAEVPPPAEEKSVATDAPTLAFRKVWFTTIRGR